MKCHRVRPVVDHLELRECLSTVHHIPHIMHLATPSFASHHAALPLGRPMAGHAAPRHWPAFRFQPAPAPVPPLPAAYMSADFGNQWGYHLNQILGDCVTAAEINISEAQLHTSGYSVIYPDSTALDQYMRVGHYVPGNPATDQGEWPLLGQFDWISHGYTDITGYTHRAAATGPVNFRDPVKLTRAIYLYGGVTLTVALPADAIAQFEAGQTWSVTAGAGGAPWSGGSHEVAAVGWDTQGHIELATWGRTQWADLSWVETYCTESYAAPSQDQITPNGHALNGLTLSQLVTDLRYVT